MNSLLLKAQVPQSGDVLATK